jgi:hypothetical protein
MALIIPRSTDRVPAAANARIAADELVLALEQIADVLSEDERPLTPEERADILALVSRMKMGERVPRAVAFCPER